MESHDPRLGVRFHEVRIQRMIIGMKQQGALRARASVGLPDAVQVHIDHRIAINHGEAVGQLIEARQYCPGCAERFLLDHVANPHLPPAAIAEMPLDQIRAITNEKDEVGETVAARQFDQMFQQRFAADVDHRLGQIAQALP